LDIPVFGAQPAAWYAALISAKDIISLDTLKRLTTDLARHLLGLEAEAIELLETQHQPVEDRRADLVAWMNSAFVNT
jgi:hypothetical protein